MNGRSTDSIRIIPLFRIISDPVPEPTRTNLQIAQNRRCVTRAQARANVREDDTARGLKPHRLVRLPSCVLRNRATTLLFRLEELAIAARRLARAEERTPHRIDAAELDVRWPWRLW